MSSNPIDILGTLSHRQAIESTCSDVYRFISFSKEIESYDNLDYMLYDLLSNIENIEMISEIDPGLDYVIYPKYEDISYKLKIGNCGTGYYNQKDLFREEDKGKEYLAFGISIDDQYHDIAMVIYENSKNTETLSSLLKNIYYHWRKHQCLFSKLDTLLGNPYTTEK